MRSLHNIMVKVLSFLLEASMALLVLDVLLGVVSRYVVGKQVSWTEELACLLLVWSSFFGIALAFNSRSHLGIDLIVKGVRDGHDVLYEREMADWNGARGAQHCQRSHPSSPMYAGTGATFTPRIAGRSLMHHAFAQCGLPYWPEWTVATACCVA